jgi:hypothetical protein
VSLCTLIHPETALGCGRHMIEGSSLCFRSCTPTIAQQPRMSVSLPGEYHLFGYQEAVEKSFRLGQGLVYNILAVLVVIINLANPIDTVAFAVRLARR